MHFLPIFDRAGVTVPADGASNTQVLMPYLSVEGVEHLTLETLVHELHLPNLLAAFELRVYAAACSARDPEVIFRGPLLMTLDLMGSARARYESHFHAPTCGGERGWRSTRTSSPAHSSDRSLPA
jgi:hypothetical protein